MLAFAGTAPFGAALLRGLVEPPEGLVARRVALVISQPDRPAGRGRKVSRPAVAELADELGLPLLQPERIDAPDVDAALREADVSTIVVAAFGQLIREPMLSDYLMLNVHGSLLPEYRGAAPIERAIMDERTETGVCIMRMDVGLDTGPVASTTAVPIGPDDDAGTIYERCQQAGILLLHDALDAAEHGKLEFVPQPEVGTYAAKISAADRALNVAGTDAAAHAQVRALSPHIGAYLSIDGTRVTVWKSAVVEASDPLLAPASGRVGSISHNSERMAVGCAVGALELVEVQPAGKRCMAAGDWLRGLREPLTRADDMTATPR